MKKSAFIIFSLLASSIAFAECGDVPYSFMADDRCSDVRNTKHNFSASDVVQTPGSTSGDGRKVKAVSNQEVCVYCHTPHGDPNKASTDRNFLWNRSIPSQVYSDKYSSSSLNAPAQNIGQGSRMCLSCHDGTVAIGQVDVVNGRLTRSVVGYDSEMMTPSEAISMTGENLDADGSLKEDAGGYTANLGEDLSNDHPLGFDYNSQLATDDGELQDPANSPHIGVRVGGGVAHFNQALADAGGTAGGSNPVTASTRVALPLESAVGVRANGETNFVSIAAEGTVECTTCHDPHIRSTNTAENIKFLRLHRFQKQQPTALATGVAEPDFSINNDINCVACHKKAGWSSSVHAQAANTYDDLQDSVKQREFPAATKVWEASCLNCHDPHTETGANWLLRAGADGSNKSAIEETCFECHGNSPIVSEDNGKAIANIQSLNALSGHQAFDFSTSQAHNPKSADLDETQQNLKDNRHVTCSDCHNPHRTLANSTHDGGGTSGSALHAHGAGITHSNKLSGALNGVSGLLPDSAGVASFEPYNPNSAITYTELQGVIDQSSSNAATVVTKEYQVCLKCHSDYSDIGIGQIDPDGDGVKKKANIAMEISDVAVSYHPVAKTSNANVQAGKADMTKTDSDNFTEAFQSVGTQTMYCSDCHTNDDPNGAQGPHGSSVDRILAASGDTLCASCHKADQYQNATAGTVQASGFSCTTGNCAAAEVASQNANLHIFHASKASGGLNVCTDCHVAVPHGWKYKALLADVNDALNTDTRYYKNAKAKIDTMQASGEWTRASCGSNGGCHTP